jgi:hypothetical protein
MLAGAYGDGGAVGESYSTARRIKDKDIESWTVEWTTTADRIEGTNTGSDNRLAIAASSVA